MAGVGYYKFIEDLEKNFQEKKDEIVAGLQNAMAEIIRKDSKIWILDGAHNAAAAECLAETLRECWPDTKFTAVTGVFKDKEYSKIAAILSGVLNHAICIDLPEVGRSLPKEELAAVYAKVGVKSDVSDSIKMAIKEATSDAVLVTGSLSLLRSAKDGIEKFYF